MTLFVAAGFLLATVLGGKESRTSADQGATEVTSDRPALIARAPVSSFSGNSASVPTTTTKDRRVVESSSSIYDDYAFDDQGNYVDATVYGSRQFLGVSDPGGAAPGVEHQGEDPFSNGDATNPSAGEIDNDEAAEEEPYARNAFIAGRVLNESGEALVGVGVTATAIHLFDVPPSVTVPVGDMQRHTVSDTAGQYRFEQLVAGEYRINNVPTDMYGMTQTSVRSGVNFADIVVKTQRQLHVVGQVTDTMGLPLAGALVQPQVLGERGAYTDSSGRFELQLNIRENATGLGIRAELYGYRGKMTILGANQIAGEASATVSIELEALEKHAVVTGVLRSAATGEPVARKTVQLLSTQDRDRYHATSNMDGRFVMTAVEADKNYELLVAGGGGYATYAQPNVPVGESGLDLELLLQADENKALVGRMVNLHGLPIPNFSLIARAAKPPFQSMRVTSDAVGNFVLRNPPQGPLVFESQSLPHLQISGVQARNDIEQAVVLTLDIGRDEIYGYVVNENGEPVSVPNVVVSWRHTQNGITSASTRRAAADAQGGFLFRQLGPGVHTISVNVPGYKPARVDHDAAVQGYEFVVRLEQDSAG